jgi:hypothetical protein
MFRLFERLRSLIDNPQDAVRFRTNYYAASSDKDCSRGRRGIGDVLAGSPFHVSSSTARGLGNTRPKRAKTLAKVDGSGPK